MNKFRWKIGDANSEKSSLEMTLRFSSFSNSLLIGSNAPNGTLLFGLNTGWAFSLISNFAFSFVHVPRPSEKTCGNFLFNSVLNFSVAVIVLVVTIFTWLLNELIYRSQRSNEAKPICFVVFFSTNTSAFWFLPRKKCYWRIRLKI